MEYNYDHLNFIHWHHHFPISTLLIDAPEAFSDEKKSKYVHYHKVLHKIHLKNMQKEGSLSFFWLELLELEHLYYHL